MRIITTRRFLKKIIIFLLIIILFFLFKNNVSASELVQGTLKLEYSETFIETIDNNETRINNLIDYMRRTNRFGWNTSTYTYLDSGNYVVRVQNLNTDTWKVYITDATQSYNYLKSELTTYQKRLQYYTGYQLSMDVTFSGNNVVRHSNQSVGSAYISYYVPSNCDITTSDCTSYITDTYYDITFLSDTSTIQYNNCTDTNCQEFKIEVGTRIFAPSNIVPSKEFFGYFRPNRELIISYELIKQNGYYDLQLNMENYTGETIQEGKQVFLVDTSTGKQTFISPDVNGLPNRTMTIQVYFPTTYKYQIIDTNTIEVIYEEIINIPSIEYDNFFIKINNINTQNKTINYSYVNNGNTRNFKCYHQIENGTLLEDLNCTNIDNNYTINLTQNKNINFIIKDMENNIIFEESRNFVMSYSTPFIEFKENYEYNLLNIKVLFNRFNTTDYVAKYQINNEPIVTIVPTQEQSTYNDIFSYIIYNITEKSVIKAFIFDNNNNLIASSTFNITNTYIQQQNYYNIDSTSFKDLFNNLSFKNISSELIDLINRIGNIVLSSRLGIIIFTTFLITLIGLVINLIRR